MQQQTRREFLAGAGVVAAGAGAILGLQGTALGQMDPGGLPHSAQLRALIPGAVDADGQYVLPKLSYAYDALAAVIDAETMKLHHSKHHQGYVNGLIAAEKALAEAREKGDFALVDHWSRKAAFHGAGHFLHCVFWDSMTPGGSAAPSGQLAAQIERDFGSHAAMMAHFNAASKAVEGSGWGILGWSIGAGKLVILQAMNHQLLTQWAVVPLLALDVWEHAYYLKYQNNRAAYVDGFATVIDWKRVEARFALLGG